MWIRDDVTRTGQISCSPSSTWLKVSVTCSRRVYTHARFINGRKLEGLLAQKRYNLSFSTSFFNTVPLSLYFTQRPYQGCSEFINLRHLTKIVFTHSPQKLMQNSLEICFKSKQKFSFTILKDCQWKIVWKVFKSLFFFGKWTRIRYFTFLVPDSFICRLATVPSSSSICPLEQLASTLLPCHDRWKKRKIFIQSFVLLMNIKGF